MPTNPPSTTGQDAREHGTLSEEAGYDLFVTEQDGEVIYDLTLRKSCTEEAKAAALDAIPGDAEMSDVFLDGRGSTVYIYIHRP